MWIMIETGSCWLYARPGGATMGKWRILDGKGGSGSPRTCRLRLGRLSPVATSIELCTDTYGRCGTL
jgi:hypothetical protein